MKPRVEWMLNEKMNSKSRPQSEATVLEGNALLYALDDGLGVPSEGCQFFASQLKYLVFFVWSCLDVAGNTTAVHTAVQGWPLSIHTFTCTSFGFSSVFHNRSAALSKFFATLPPKLNGCKDGGLLPRLHAVPSCREALSRGAQT